MVAATAKKTKVVTHRQQSNKIGSGRNVGGDSNNNGNGNDGDGDSVNDNDDNNSSNGGGGGKEDKGVDTQTTIN